MTSTCPSCGCEQGAGLLCASETDRLERALGDVASVIEELSVTLSKMGRIGISSGPGGLARERSPIDVGALEAATHLRDALTGWARDVSNEAWRPTEQDLMVHGGQTRSAARLLLSEVNAIRRHDAVKDLVAEIDEAISQARRVVDRPADRIYLGQCLHEEAGVTCYSEIWASPSASSVQCKVCGVTHPVTERRVWLLQRAEDMLFTAAKASEILGEIGHITVTQARIRGYIHRGKIAYRAPVDAKRFRLGDLLALLVDESERRSA